MTTTSREAPLISAAQCGPLCETARRLGELGYRVWLGARDAGQGGTAAQTLRNLGYDVRAIDIAVDDGARVGAAAARIVEEDGKLDVLIANAGIPGSYAHPAEQSPDEIRHVYEVNVYGAIRLTQSFTPLLKAAGSATTVNVSSELGSLGSLSDLEGEFSRVNIQGYDGSKTAATRVTVSFAEALAPFGIRVNSADLGYSSTNFNGHTGYRTVELVAGIIVQLATSDDAGLTGKFLNDRRALPW